MELGHDVDSFSLRLQKRQSRAWANSLAGRRPMEKAVSCRSPALFRPAQGKARLIISSANGVHALDKGMDILKKGVTRSTRWLRRSLLLRRSQ